MEVKLKRTVVSTTFENYRKEGVHWDGRAEKDVQLEESVGYQSPSAEARPRRMKGQEMREQRRYHKRSDCQMSDGEG